MTITGEYFCSIITTRWRVLMEFFPYISVLSGVAVPIFCSLFASETPFFFQSGKQKVMSFYQQALRSIWKTQVFTSSFQAHSIRRVFSVS